MMKKTIFNVPKMDCPSEEKLIRMAFAGQNEIKNLEFDLKGRKLTVIHSNPADAVLTKLEPLNFGAKLYETNEIELDSDDVLQITKDLESNPNEAKVLKQLLAINAIMFVIELFIGFIAQSTGLIADSMDMFADATVYGISLYAVGKSIQLQKKSARLSGYMQMGLALFALVEVTRRFFYGSEPLALYMMAISVVALIANVTCLLLISKQRTGAVHMEASYIFSTNDVIANVGVIIAGAAVYFTRSPYPDLIVGLIIAAVVFRGSISILRISKN